MPYRPAHPRALDPRLPPQTETSWTGLGAGVLAMVLWSAGNVMVRWVSMPGVQIAFWRIALSASVYGLYLRLRGRRITRQQFVASAPAAVAISLEIAVFWVAIKNTTVANATILAALQPIILLGTLSRFGERVTRALVAISVTAVGGIVLVVVGSAEQPTWSPRGDLLAFVALLLFSAYFFYAKRARATVPALEFQTAVWMIGTVTLLPIALVDAGGLVFPSWTNWAWLVGLFAVPGTGHLLVNWAHGRLRLSVSSMLTLLLPVLSALGAALFLDESVSWLQALGMAIVLTALAATVRRTARLDARRA